jgi:galactofuranose transport system permease protein
VKKVLKHRLLWPVVALVALIAINTATRPAFLSVTVRDGQLYGSLIDILRNSAPLMLVALGMTIVIAARGIDLSVGAVMAVSGAVALTIIDGSPAPHSLPTVAVAIVVAILVSFVLGAWNGFLVAVVGIQPIIATLVLMLAGRGIALLITGGFITTVNSDPYKFMAQGYIVGFPFAFYVSLVAIAIVALVERRTALGMLTESVGINPQASRLAGVRSRGIVWGAYIACGVLAGIAGILYSSNIMAADANAAGLYIELYAILAVVLGGTSLMGGKFSIAGTVIGVFTIQTLISTITYLGVPPAASPVFMATAVIIVVLLQSPRVHRVARNLTRSLRLRGRPAAPDDASGRTGTTARADTTASGGTSAGDETKVTLR